jgi:hypothetical protein
MGTTSIERVRGARRFILRFLELQIPMALGAFVCYVLGSVISDRSGLALAYHPGTYLFAIGDVLFLTVPVAAWMLIRERHWQPGLEMALAMVAPVAIVALVGEVLRYHYLLWLVTGMYPLMCLGMIADIAHRRDRHVARNVAPAWTAQVWDPVGRRPRLFMAAPALEATTGSRWSADLSRRVPMSLRLRLQRLGQEHEQVPARDAHDQHQPDDERPCRLPDPQPDHHR